MPLLVYNYSHYQTNKSLSLSSPNRSVSNRSLSRNSSSSFSPLSSCSMTGGGGRGGGNCTNSTCMFSPSPVKKQVNSHVLCVCITC